MGSAQRVALAIVGVALATTLVLPDRLTAKVINAFAGLFNGALATAMNVKKR